MCFGSSKCVHFFSVSRQQTSEFLRMCILTKMFKGTWCKGCTKQFAFANKVNICAIAPILTYENGAMDRTRKGAQGAAVSPVDLPCPNYCTVFVSFKMPSLFIRSIFFRVPLQSRACNAMSLQENAQLAT